MKVLFAGGGSGGHVTPLRAIATELQTEKTELEITIITDRKFYSQTEFLFKNQPEVKLKRIFSGKFRRYNGKSVVWHVLHIPTLLYNVRDLFFIGIGIVQSLIYFLFNKPDVVFCKGGYVCVPVGVVAHMFKVPLVIHDSDTHPGLTNRFLSHWAKKIATGMPTRYYQYSKKKMTYTGIPVNADFQAVDSKTQAESKTNLGLDPNLPLVLVTGGGTGAKQLNITLSNVAEELLEAGWQIVQLTGKNKDDKSRSSREKLPIDLQTSWVIEEFAEILPYVQAADVIVSRAGATAMQEFANAKKTVVMVPSPYLTGGHQLKNAQMFNENNAAFVLQESLLASSPQELVIALEELRTDPKQSKQLATNLHTHFAKPNASKELAKIILDISS